MGILRSDIVSHSSLATAGGSVQFDGSDDALKTADSDTYALKTNDFTIECWLYSTSDNAYDCWFSNDDYASGTGGIALYKNNSELTAIVNPGGGQIFSGNGTVSLNTWHHVAFVRQSGNYRYYLNGEIIGEDNYYGSYNIVGNSFIIGANKYNNTYPSYEWPGYISNVRVVNGRAVYGPGNFTVPKFKLKNIPGTVLLCCQSSSSTTEAAVGDGALSANSAPVASGFSPFLKEDITDIGPVFADNTKFDTLSYMVPPGGTTTQRGRGRGVLGGGAPFVSPNVISNMQYIEIQSGGIFKDFGDLTVARGYFPAGHTSSSTRGLSAGGWTGSDNNTIDYITIATTSNATEFGDTSVVRPSGGLSNQTRSVNGGDAAMTNTMDYVTIATTGNAADFGDLTEGRQYVAGVASPTRGVFGGGRNNTPSSNTLKNTMEYITIASTGNAADFGDISSTRYGHTGFSSSVRGIWAGGYASPGQTKLIDYFTIATTGNSADFGDLSINNGYCGSVTNSIRGAVTINDAPNYYNTIEYITIATLGDAKDFGDSDPTGSGKGHGDFPSSISDSHGGIS